MTPEQALQQPAREDVEALLRRDALRGFRIDIESDSTIRGDLARNQQQMAGFLTGTAQFWATMGPLVKEQPKAAGPAIEVYSAFSRQFKLGKQAEDALDRMADEAKKAGEQQKQPTAEEQAAQAEAEDKKRRTDIEQQKVNNDKEDAERRYGLDKQKADTEAARSNREEFRVAREDHRLEQDIGLRQDAHNHSLAMAAREKDFRDREYGQKVATSERDYDHAVMTAGREHDWRVHEADTRGNFERDRMDRDFADKAEARALGAKPHTTVQFDAKDQMGQAAQSLQAMAAQNSDAIVAVAGAVQQAAQQMAQSSQLIAQAAQHMAAPRRTRMSKMPDGTREAISEAII